MGAAEALIKPCDPKMRHRDPPLGCWWAVDSLYQATALLLRKTARQSDKTAGPPLYHPLEASG